MAKKTDQDWSPAKNGAEESERAKDALLGGYNEKHNLLLAMSPALRAFFDRDAKRLFCQW